MRRLSLLTVFLVAFDMIASGQVIYMEARPEGAANAGIIDEWYDLAIRGSLIDSLRMAESSKERPFRFAVGREVMLNPSNAGKVYLTDQNRSVWYLPVFSKGAASLNVIFSSFHLSEGETLFIYDPSGEHVIGPLTSMNNSFSGLLATAPVPGDSIIIEYHIQNSNPGSVTVGKISHDYLGVFGAGDTKDEFFGTSGLCNVDINCSSGNEWQTEKKAVVRIISQGIEIGTGFMVNNTNQENIPYLITAYHVVNTEEEASESLFYFGYESPWCEGPDGKTNMTLSGSEIICSKQDLDFTMLKLSSFPPLLYRPYLAGWDVTGSTPLNTVSIHHPQGDVKKISTDNDPPVTGTFPGLFTNGSWKILAWDSGTTEAGSSGAPLFNQDHRVVGYLSGGEAVCGRSVNDYFGRLDIAWDQYSSIYESLMPWLDPSRSGVGSLDGRDPYEPNYQTFDTLRNFLPTGKYLTPYEYPDTGFTTGFNSDSITLYAEEFESPGTMYVTDVLIDIGKANALLPEDSINICLFSGDGQPAVLLAVTKIKINEVKDDYLLRANFHDPVQVSGQFFVGYRLWYRQPVVSESRQFAVYHGSTVPDQENSAWFYNTSGWHRFTEHPYDPGGKNLFVSAVVAGNTIASRVPFSEDTDNRFIVYPSPFSSAITIEMPEPVHDYAIITIHTLDGRAVIRRRITEGASDYVIEGLGDLRDGIYILTIEYSGKYESHKLLKQGR